MRLLLICLIGLMLSVKSMAQDNLQVQFGYRGSIAAAKFLPSTQIMEGRKFELGLQYSFWVANQSLTYSSIRKIYKQNRLTRTDVNDIIDQLDTDNRLGIGQDFLVMGFGLKTNIRQHEYVWNFTISDRFNINTSIPKALVQLAWQGNRQFIGRNVDLSKTSLAGLYFREYSMGLATQIAQWGEWSFRGGLRFNYYQGLSGINNARSEFYVNTFNNADSIKLDYDFDYFYTGIETFDLFNPKGSGFGVNLGATFSYKDVLNFDIGIVDIGSIRFTNEVTRIGSSNSLNFSGLGFDDILDPLAFVDSLEQVFTPRVDSLRDNSFKMPVGTKLSLMASWKFGETSMINGPKTLYLYYTQGFSENPGVTAFPKFTAAIHRPMFRHLDIGFSASFGGFNDFALGGLIGIHFKRLRFSVQSDDFTGFIVPEKTTGAGGGFMLELSF